MKRRFPIKDLSNYPGRVRTTLAVREVLERAARRTGRAEGSAVDIVGAHRREHERELARRLRS